LEDSKLYDLLKGFFKFYSYIDDGGFRYRINISSDERQIARNSQYVFDIEDPFDRMHNPGDRPLKS
jgi:hypothetical protein